jgi:hypothetical protein
MATTPLPEEKAPSSPPPPSAREIRVYSHSSLFYWWPVWACGLVMALLTFIDGHRMALVPSHTMALRDAKGMGEEKPGKRVEFEGDVLVLPQGKHLEPYSASEPEPPEQPYIYMSRHKDLGVLFAITLLIIIFISNVPLRGLWSVILILGIVLMVVLFAFWGILGTILDKFALLQIHINAAGYLTISLVLLALWAITVFIFDHRRYVIFTSGQVRVSLAVGAGETVYGTRDLTFEKRQDDLFRHWIVGLGSGDLIIHRSGTTQEIDMPNVLFVGAKIREIEKLIKEQEVV